MNEFKAYLISVSKPKEQLGIDEKKHLSVTGTFKMFGMEEEGERGSGDLFKFNFNSERHEDTYKELMKIAVLAEAEQGAAIIEWNKGGYLKFQHKTVKWRPYWNHNVLTADKGQMKKGQAEIIKFGQNHPLTPNMPQVAERITAIKLARSLDDLDAMIDNKKRQIERLGMVITEDVATKYGGDENVHPSLKLVMQRILEDARLKKVTTPVEETVVEK